MALHFSSCHALSPRAPLPLHPYTLYTGLHLAPTKLWQCYDWAVIHVCMLHLVAPPKLILIFGGSTSDDRFAGRAECCSCQQTRLSPLGVPPQSLSRAVNNQFSELCSSRDKESGTSANAFASGITRTVEISSPIDLRHGSCSSGWQEQTSVVRRRPWRRSKPFM